VNLSDFKGHDTIVLFWNTGCGFCQQMLPALREWETRRPKGAPKLLVVSSGSKDEMRAMGLRSTVVVDAQFTVAPAYGTGGTPTAILVDSTGRIASDMAIGADAIMALANSKNPNLVAV
jgi:thiol-disulfide isomerase/thioredoxin